MKQCVNCKKSLLKEVVKEYKRDFPKTCPWCRRPQASRQSLRSFKPKRK